MWSMIGVTNLIGQNDSAGEIFSLSDAKQAMEFAQHTHIGEVSMWETSRDNGSCPGNTTDQDTCSGLSQSTYAFTNSVKEYTSGNGHDR
ncbi:MAG TPA: hypothetical protein VHZ51_15740 [Ktedonobacteraceae bacterium]|nr:hypothetical protein [Ktedonobacteraceae bacterium]